MEEKNELNDIILNKGGEANGNKKIILAVATLGVILIIVVMLMNTLTSNGTDNLPQAVLPPEPNVKPAAQQNSDESLFEEIEVIEEEKPVSDNLDKIAQRLKQESKEEEVAKKPVSAAKPEKKEAPAKEVVKAEKKETPAPAVKSDSSQKYYIQVGSFSKYEPNKKFLKSITDQGYSYMYHKVTSGAQSINKVLVGPFGSEKEARSALRSIRTSIEAGAFLTKI